ncbi:MAG TPA: PSD1 and planctomycete cytochrome C domain-containing protein [Tepidisphaeraceae bacterium]|nr:PSD1 and planctomycete cytochrome C domain-containing protein [Tepidisphaeraceae bacterium]
MPFLAASFSAWVQTVGRLHVLTVHFPIALLFLAGCIEAIRMIRRKAGPSPVSGTLLTLGAIAAVAAAGMGWILHGDDPIEGLLAYHLWLGFAAAGAAIIAAVLAPIAMRIPRVTPLFRAWTIAVAILVSLTGHYGGEMTHGEGYLTELLFPGSGPKDAPTVENKAPIAAVSTSQKIDFSRDIQPIFQQSCYECHGPDKKKGGLRLDARAFLLKGGGNGCPVVAGQADKSLLIQYVTGTNGKKRMPLNKDPLKPEQIAKLRAWINEGANWPDALANDKAANAKHWAFVAPVRPAIPEVKDKAWVRNPIDSYVLANLEKEGLKPSPEADRPTLIRRVSLDLVGLPPTIKEVDDFVNDPAPDAYEKVVDRLLASPHFGERWGRHWLDLARYADTNGYEKDRMRVIWPYRDWVINALNKDLPFNQFVIDQIAGDMLPNATADQKIATGFHRNTMFNEEGGIDVEEFRYKALVDRVQTTSTTFLGLTVHCAQCHDHKYDPISQKEYYSLMALLNDADEPEMDVPDPAIAKQRQAQQAKIQQIVAGLEEKFPTHRPAMAYEVLRPSTLSAASGAAMKVQPDGAVLVAGVVPETDTYTLEFSAPSFKGVTELKLEALTHKKLPRQGPGRSPENGNFVLSELRATLFPKGAATSQPSQGKPVVLADAHADWEQEGFPAAAAIDGNPQTGWAIHNPSGLTNTNRTLTVKLKDLPESFNGTLVVTLDQQFPKHSLGHFRLSLGRASEVPHSDLPIAEQRQNFVNEEMAAWEKDITPKCAHWTTLDPAKYSRAHEGSITKLPDKTLLFTGDNYYREDYQLEYPVAGVTGIRAIRLDVLPDDRLEGGGPGRDYNNTGGFLVSEFTAKLEPAPTQVADAGPVSVPASQPADRDLTFASASASGGTGIEHAIDGKKDSHWIDFDAVGKPQSAVFVLKDRAPADSAGSRLALSILQNYHQCENLGRVRISVSDDARDDWNTSGVPLEIEQILLTPAADRTQSQQQQLRAYFLSTTPLLAAEHAKIAQLKASMPKYVTTMVMTPRAVDRTTNIHHRGEFLQLDAVVHPGTPAILPPLPKDAKPDRLALARWLVSDDNPLIGRVTMNRVWSRYFGRGIVYTIGDFGTMGERPSNPELLDYLATELPRQHWSMKAMHRLIVTSATYRQSSHVTPELEQKDPQNILLARGPRLRVEAETVRDVALDAAGLLSDKIGGPSVFPPQPPGVEELSYGPLAWKTSPGQDKYRRGLYTFLKRTSMYPGLVTFDEPSSELVCPIRPRSNTPLQALTTLNDAVFMEAAQALARRTIKESPAADPESRTTYAFRLCLSRKPTPAEVSAITQFYQAQLMRFKSDPATAAKLTGASPKTPELADLAAWTTVSRAILNLDETVTKE